MSLIVNRIKISVFITLVSVIASVLITLFMMETFANGIDSVTLSISIIAPAIIAPSVTWYLVALTVRVQQLEKEQRNLATYDMLTGLLTRRVFLSSFEALLQLTQRKQSSLTLGYIDIDNFKKINDEYGHAAGDAVLKSFAAKLRDSMRKSDLLGRIGGEEFAVVLPDTDMPNSLSVLEKINLLTKKSAVHFSGHSIAYTVSIGVTVFNKENQGDLEQLMMQADKALYQAKHSGKDCIIKYAKKKTRHVA